ncbi:MAG: lysozyme inhibitor LprI family protein [Caulobacteraceae bacterium]|nr:lysozyme inhibitor LprI family protein [Caulobacteraceae bacterium]
MSPRLTGAAAILCFCSAILAQPALAEPTAVQSPQGLSADYGRCLERAGRNTVQLAMCEQTEMAAQDARLNKAYKQVMGQLAKDPPKQSALRNEQRSWLKKRDYDCKLDQQTINSSCIVEKTAARANELEKMIRF